MSSAAAWSYTAVLTLWPSQGRSSDWDGVPQYSGPVRILGDYKFDAKTLANQAGEEFVSTLLVYTEYSGAKVDDFVAVGDFLASPNPIPEAGKIRLVTRFADTLERLADDYVLVT